ncbi:hypothetical protein BDZ89DRAFT_1057486 [Hymenopellis radicata]|nr:hypothetical protein BDZ89DRAFT_1057486 [Hymenopellis radicata]
MSATSTHGDVQRTLDQLRDSPVGSDLSEDTLKQIYDYLMSVSDGNDIHWFCGKASTTTVAAATFSLRLHAYESPNVLIWRAKLLECLSHCTECVHALEKAKTLSRNTYLGAFHEDTKTDFNRSFEQSEANSVIDILARVGLSPTQTSPSTKSLSDVPSAVVYRMLANFGVFQDERILSIIDKYPPSVPVHWPLDILPAGMLLLLLHRNPLVREWATKQAAKCTIVPIPNEAFNGPYSEVLKVIAFIYSPPSTTTIPSMANLSHLRAFFVTEPILLWSSFLPLLKLIPPESLVSGTFQHVDIRRVLVAHLHDTGPEFSEIMNCFILLIKRLGRRLWLAEGPEYPQIVFDSIKDNPSFTIHIHESGGARRHIVWFREYLSLIPDLSIHSTVCLKMLSFLCEELQHERFSDSRPATLSFAAFLLKSEEKHPELVSQAFRIHGNVLTALAFSQAYSDPRWNDARTQTRDLIVDILLHDLKALSAGMTTLCEALGNRKPSSAAPIHLREHVWNAVYDSLQASDSDGIHVIISVMSQASHIDDIHTAAFTNILGTPAMQQLFQLVKTGIRSVRNGFLNTVSFHCERTTTSSAISLLQTPGMTKNVMKLMLSPVDDLRGAAQLIVGLAFDVDIRADCFRALLTNDSDASFEGMFDFLSVFNRFANFVPEACSLAKSLVRGFTDIIEVLCQHPNGLLLQPSFLRSSESSSPALQLPKLWTLMSQAIALIFKRTPAWAKFFEPNVMITWMRDALIFGQEMLSEVQTFKSAAERVSSLSSSVKAETGSNMLEGMQHVLTELARWLRLTDEELLHQSYSLLESLFSYFRENGTTPHKDSIDRLKRYLKAAREEDSISSGKNTRLSTAKLTQLELLLASVQEVIVIPDDSEGEDLGTTPIVISDDEEEEEVKPIPRKTPKADSKPAPQKVVPSKSSKPSTLNNRAPVPAPSKKVTAVKADKGFFSERDQRRLEQAGAIAKNRKSSTASAGPSKPIPKGPRNAAPSSASSSGDSSDDDEESQGSVLKKMALPKSPKIKHKDKPRRQIKTMDMPTSAFAIEERRKRQEEQRVQEAQYRAYQRRNPEFNNLYRTLLAWNYDHDGPIPPGPTLRTWPVPDRFNDHQDYLRVFEPLLMHELWAQVCSSKENTSQSFPCTITSKSTINHWTKVDIKITDVLPKDWYLTENDVVLLRHRQDKSKSALAKVDASRSAGYQSPGLSATLKFCFDENRPDPGIQINSTWSITKALSLSTVSREYAALATIQYYDFKDVIFSPQLAMPNVVDLSTIQKTMEVYRLNEPQAKAVECALKSEGFSLIQGPPGTGKTSTICALVAATTERRPRPISGSTNRSSTPKVLVCAPSNAAIDEITYRLKEGYRGSVKTNNPLKVVRLGSGVGDAVRDVQLEQLVDKALNPNQCDDLESLKNQDVTLNAIHAELSAVIEETKLVDDAISTHTITQQQQLQIRRHQIRERLNAVNDQRRKERKDMNQVRRQAQFEVLQDAQVICTTLSGAGHSTLQDAQLDFDVIIIDEAAQAIELSTLVPLKFTCKRCILVGDPNQLPPTVMSGQATKQLYNQSLFVRLQKQQPKAVHLLSIQYRMHPEISLLPSKLFYEGRLTDGPEMASKTAQPWHADSKFGVYRVFNVAGNQEQAPNKSMKNSSEAQMVLLLYNRLQLRWGNKMTVGVISPYRGQISELKTVFREKFGRDILDYVTFNTVDGFQGQEKDIIILSTVRAGPGVQSIGFLNDMRRMNVALTRAKSSVFLVGNTPTLERSDATWKLIISDARERGLLVDASKTYFTESSNPAASTPSLQKKKSMKSVVAQSRPDGSRSVSGVKRKLSASAEERPESSSRPQPGATAPTLTPLDSHSPTRDVASPPNDPHPTNGLPPKPPRPHPTNGLPPKPTRPHPTNGLPPKPPRPTQPPLKKKKKEPNLFIPKKAQKRPPDGDAGAGPSNRQRLA